MFLTMNLSIMAFHQDDYGIQMGRRNLGLDLSPEGIPSRIPKKSGPGRLSPGIMITSEDGWCVPYNDDTASLGTGATHQQMVERGEDGGSDTSHTKHSEDTGV